MKAFAVAALIALILAGTALGTTSSPDINRVASIFAQRPVTALCYEPAEPDSPDSYGAWGYVEKPLAQTRTMHLDGLLCAGVLSVNDQSVPGWQRALGVAVIVHEAYHLRRWGAADNEAKVECRAIRHWKVAARMFGATEQTVAELWPYALAEHYELASYQDIWTGDRPYYDPTCDVPRLIGP